jgi:hypothetical protein
MSCGNVAYHATVSPRIAAASPRSHVLSAMTPPTPSTPPFTCGYSPMRSIATVATPARCRGVFSCSPAAVGAATSPRVPSMEGAASAPPSGGCVPLDVLFRAPCVTALDTADTSAPLWPPRTRQTSGMPQPALVGQPLAVSQTHGCGSLTWTQQASGMPQPALAGQSSAVPQTHGCGSLTSPMRPEWTCATLAGANRNVGASVNLATASALSGGVRPVTPLRASPECAPSPAAPNVLVRHAITAEQPLVQHHCTLRELRASRTSTRAHSVTDELSLSERKQWSTEACTMSLRTLLVRAIFVTWSGRWWRQLVRIDQSDRACRFISRAVQLAAFAGWRSAVLTNHVEATTEARKLVSVVGEPEAQCSLGLDPPPPPVMKFQ